MRKANAKKKRNGHDSGSEPVLAFTRTENQFDQVPNNPERKGAIGL
jgi:hypothetical protein